jgi:hypothetical protein
MNFVEIRKEMEYQLCHKLNRTCDENLNLIIDQLMYFVQHQNTTMTHKRYGTMEIKNQHYFNIDFEITYNIIDVKLWYWEKETYKSYHKIYIKY